MQAKVCVALGVGLALVSGCGESPSRKTSTGNEGDLAAVEEIDHEATDQCSDRKDNDGDGFVDCDDLDCRTAASDHCRFAPELDRSVPTSLAEASRFLYTAPDPAQRDVDQDALEVRRTSVIHGEVVGPKGKALRDVRVSVQDHPEYGYSISRSDGRYDLVVNGGGVMLLAFERKGYLSAWRSVATEWQREHVAPEVGMVRLTAEVQRVAVGKGQVVGAEKVKDEYGTRQPFVVFEKGTRAELLLPGGEHKELAELHLRVTEYPFEAETASVPNATARFVPGSMPSRGSLDYSIDFTVDEAVEFDARKVEFSSPVAYYVQNFLGLPVGSDVPLSSYDPTTSEWGLLSSGRVVGVVSVKGGRASLDLDGDGKADSQKALSKLGVTMRELDAIGARCEAGDSLWRHSVEHFSAFTDSWTSVAPGSAVPPTMSFELKPKSDDTSVRGNVLVEDQVVRESVDVAGTPYSLVYQANRNPAYAAAYHVSVPLIGDEVPDGLRTVYVVIEIAGQLFPADVTARVFTPEPGLTYEFIWNGRNAFGQLLQGAQIARVWVGYAFAGTLPGGLDSSVLAGPLGAVVPDAVLWSRQDVPLGMLDSQGYQFGGFGLDVQHAYDPIAQVIYFGDGSQRHADRRQVTILAMDQRSPGSSDAADGSSHLEEPDSVVVAPDGSAYVTDDGQQGRVWEISPSGQYTTVLGAGAAGDAGRVELLGPQGVAIDPTDGAIYVVDYVALKVWRMRSGGTVDVLLAKEQPAHIEWTLEDPDGIAVGPNREIYLADANRVLKIHPNTGQVESAPYAGGVELAAGYGLPLDISDVSQADQVPLDEAAGVAVDRTTGTVFVASRRTHQVWRIEPNGKALLVAGVGTAGFSGDGLLAVDAELSGPRGLALGADGSLYIADQDNGRIRRVYPNGQIMTVAGGGDAFPSAEMLGIGADLNRPDGLVFGPDGSAYVGGAVQGDELPHLFRAFSGSGASFGVADFIVPSSDGRVAYHFDPTGRHLETVNVMTGKPELSFEYDSSNMLTKVTDLDGRETEITRGSDNRATRIDGPQSGATELGHDGEGNLDSVSSVVDASGNTRETTFEYEGTNGLLSAAHHPEGKTYTYEFDDKGRIKHVTGPMGFDEKYSSTSVASGQRVSVKIPDADGEDTYERQSASASVIEGFTFETRDSDSLKSSVKADNTFEMREASGAVVSGILSPTPQWGDSVRYPSERTLTTPKGKKLTTLQTNTVTGLSYAADGTVADPLEFDTYETTVEVNGATARRTYDKSTKTLTMRSPMGRTIVTEFNDEGRPVRVEIPGTAATVYAYNGDGRLESMTREADGTERVSQWHYGPNGRVDYTTDPLSHKVSYDYDELDRTTWVSRDDGAITTFGYDGNDNVIWVAPPGQPNHVFAFEEGTSLVDYFPPDNGDTGANGYPSARVHYAYDKFTRPSKTNLADGSTITSNYYRYFFKPSQVAVHAGSGSSSAAGTYYVTYDTNRTQLKSVYGPVNGVEYVHDGPLLTKITPTGPSASGVINIGYDASFRRSSVQLVGSDAVAYAHDDDSLLIGAGPLTFTRDPDNGTVTATVAGSVTTSDWPNGFGELEERTAEFAGTPLFSETFERDKLGRISKLTEESQGVARTVEYGYDSAGRLESVKEGGVTTRYYYDESGNRYPESGPSGASYDEQDRVLYYGDDTFEATATGDVVRRTSSSRGDGYELVYSPLGGLETVTVLATGDVIEYETDPFGRRVGRKVNSSKPKGWLYDEGRRIIAEIDNNSARTLFVYGTHALVPELVIKAGKTYRLITDYLGSVRLVVDIAGGDVAQALDYDAWGNVTGDTNPGFQPFGFAGGLYDPLTGLVRFGNRDYDPAIGRWTARDPTGLDGGTNVYVYSLDDPVNLADHSGNHPILIGALSGATAAALYWAFTEDPSKSWGEALTDLGGAMAGGALAGAAAGAAPLLIAEGFVEAAFGVAFVGGGLGDTLSQVTQGKSTSTERFFVAGLLNATGAGMATALSKPVTPYAQSLVAGMGVKEEIAKATFQAEVGSGFAGLFYGIGTNAATSGFDWLDNTPAPCVDFTCSEPSAASYYQP